MEQVKIFDGYSFVSEDPTSVDRSMFASVEKKLNDWLCANPNVQITRVIPTQSPTRDSGALLTITVFYTASSMG